MSKKITVHENLEENYANKLYIDISNVLNEKRKQAYIAVSQSMLQAYWQIGKIIIEEEQNGELRSEYGKNVLQKLSDKLTAEFGKGFSVRTLQQMKKFYTLFPIANALRSQLTWTHYRSLLKVNNESARNWYIEEAIKGQWSSRQLERQINTLYYERLLGSQSKDGVIAEANANMSKLAPEQFIKDPYVLEFLNLKNYPELRETELEQALIDNLQNFLLELGRGFCFVARQKLMRFDDDDFYLDLVFYHSILKCYVLIDLKIGKLTHQDVGQMDSYIRMFDALQKNEDDNPTLGIILCSEPNETIAKYSVLSDNKQIFTSKYLYNLPTVEELQDYIQSQRRLIEERDCE
ncbi:PDDEXK nuclease domain-containing protein [Ruminococcus sp. HUN007]|uniref:PDDEXK nuclease domain-containing protein n=1 Tax=Ruminococcus sp. HUN007 TaxID=1514668 RepID=UPI0005D1E731|nr:PDDEXK nuclease domain-containing protein [Ruminococcus sp. HUN007]